MTEAGTTFVPLPVHEPVMRIKPAGSHREYITLEPVFIQYVQFWAQHPTLDATSRALHSLRMLGGLSDFLAEGRPGILRFLERTLTPAGFAIAPHRRESPTLYATLAGLGAIKALADLPPSAPLDKGAGVEAIGASFHDAVVVRALEAVKRCVRGGLLVDSAASDSQHTLHAVYFGVSILWNLGQQPEDYGLERDSVEELLRRCQRRSRLGYGLGFTSHPTSGLRSRPCTTTTALALRTFARAGWLDHSDPVRRGFPFRASRLSRFFHSMVDQNGGVRVFPGEPATVTATSAFVDAMITLHGDEGWKESISPQRLLSFVRSCYRQGGYAFSPQASFQPNAHCTQSALHILEKLGMLEKEVADTSEEIVQFLRALHDRKEGGFSGYRIPKPHVPKATLPYATEAALKTPVASAEAGARPRRKDVRDANPESSANLAWYNEHLEELRARFAGQYVAISVRISDENVIGSGTAEEAYEQAIARGSTCPLLVEIPPPEPEPRYKITGL